MCKYVYVLQIQNNKGLKMVSGPTAYAVVKTSFNLTICFYIN